MDEEQMDNKQLRFYRANFVELGRHPKWWFSQAMSLKKAADAVLEQVKTDADASEIKVGFITSIWKYLAGLAIENLLKGIVIAGADPRDEEHPYISPERMEPCLISHNIWTKHVDKSDNLKKLKPLLACDEDLLRLLEIYVVSMGRYHIATTAKSYAKAQYMIESLDHLPLAEFIAAFDWLYEKLHADLGKKVEEFNKKYWESSVWFRYHDSPFEP
jgi:hypothetical protein